MKQITLFLCFLFLILLCTGAFLFGRSTSQPKNTTTVDLSRDSVIRQVQSLNRFETASYTIDKALEAGTQGNQFQDLLYGDRILLIAHGKVVAGIDMNQFDPKQVVVTGTTVQVTLPAPIIFSTVLDNSETKVFDRKLGIFSKGDKDLESKARSSAENSITQAACSAGILDDAGKNAKEQITSLAKAFGYTTIQVTVPKGQCQG